jgi:hypothetical protein
MVMCTEIRDVSVSTDGKGSAETKTPLSPEDLELLERAFGEDSQPNLVKLVTEQVNTVAKRWKRDVGLVKQPDWLKKGLKEKSELIIYLILL